MTFRRKLRLRGCCYSYREGESLQDVALSAQALTSDDLEAQQVTHRMYDLGELTPGLTFAPTISAGYFIGIEGSTTEAIGASSARFSANSY